MAEKTFTITSSSPEETKEFAFMLGSLIKSPALILLKGELGTGKTLMVKGIAEGLGYKSEITSPTFNIIKEYFADEEIIHMDLYRLNHSEELLEIGFEDYLDRDAVILIEWPEIALSLIPANFIYIEIIKMTSLKRKIIVRGEGESSKQLIERLNKNADSWN